MQSIQIFNKVLVMFVVTCFYLSFTVSQLLLSLVIPIILMYCCDHIICPGLSILFLYAPPHKAWIFEKFVFELKAFSCEFKIDCILVCQLIISLNKKMVVSSRKFKFLKSWSHTCTPLILVLASIELQVLYSRNNV